MASTSATGLKQQVAQCHSPYVTTVLQEEKACNKLLQGLCSCNLAFAGARRPCVLPSTQFGNLKHPDQEPRPIPGGWAGPTFHRVTKSRQGELVGSQPSCQLFFCGSGTCVRPLHTCLSLSLYVTYLSTYKLLISIFPQFKT